MHAWLCPAPETINILEILRMNKLAINLAAADLRFQENSRQPSKWKWNWKFLDFKNSVVRYNYIQ